MLRHILSVVRVGAWKYEGSQAFALHLFAQCGKSFSYLFFRVVAHRFVVFFYISLLCGYGFVIFLM